ncbi:MAG: hypothetical protein AMK75_05845 [Planctomycetes bacterium SM23_65]|nr:MAG: hypothetical protein AMK75_05845 [Planctomycetes bacterium SM23_65]
MKRRKKDRFKNVLPPIFLLLSVALMFLPSHWTQPASNALLTLVGPIELGMNALFDGIAELPERWRISSRILRENSALTTELQGLKSEVGVLEARLKESQKLIAELRHLREVLPNPGYDLLPVQIVTKRPVSASGAPSSHSFVIRCGTTDGVRPDDLVVARYAVLGRISAVSPWVSTVRLLTHPDVGIGARTAEGVEGVLKGDGDPRCLLERVRARPPINVGDYVVTSGFQGKHPPGLLLGTVDDLTPTHNRRGLCIRVRPAVTLDQVSQVIVVRRQRLEE